MKRPKQITDIQAALGLNQLQRLDEIVAERNRQLQLYRELLAVPEGVLSPVHLHPYYRHMGFNEGDFPVTETYASNAISLPIYPGLQPADQQRVVNTLSTLLSP